MNLDVNFICLICSECSCNIFQVRNTKAEEFSVEVNAEASGRRRALSIRH